MSKHTPEPWFAFAGPPCIGGPFVPRQGDDPTQATAGIAHCGMRLRSNEEAVANRDRIIACVNFCAGFDDTELLTRNNLKKMMDVSADENERLRTLYKDALAACQAVYNLIPHPGACDLAFWELAASKCHAVVKASGGAS